MIRSRRGRKIKAPAIPPYDGTTDQSHHLTTFSHAMLAAGDLSDEAQWIAFPMTLVGAAASWYNQLPVESIYSFDQLTTSFRTNFLNSRKRKITTAELLQMKQGRGERLRNFLHHLELAMNNVEDLNILVAVSAFAQATNMGDLRSSLIRRPPLTWADLSDRVEEYIRVDEATLSFPCANSSADDKGKTVARTDSSPRRPGNRFNKYRLPQRINEVRSERRPDRDPKRHRRSGPPRKCDDRAYCRLHQFEGHTTEQCRVLRGKMEEFIRMHRAAQPTGEPSYAPTTTVNAAAGSALPLRTIDVISGGKSLAGDPANARKRHYRAIFAATSGGKRPARTGATIGFGDDDLRDNVSYPHDDPLVMVLQINQVLLKRTLVDTGAQVNLITLEALQKMGVDPIHIRPFRSPLTGFSQTEEVTAEGVIMLGVRLGSPGGPYKDLFAEFTVVNVPMAYNAIVGRPILNEAQVVVSTYHLKLKFPVSNGEVGEILGDQTTARILTV